MATEGVDAVYLTTHNWGKAAKFVQALGFELEVETDHNSGQLRNWCWPAFADGFGREDQAAALRR